MSSYLTAAAGTVQTPPAGVASLQPGPWELEAPGKTSANSTDPRINESPDLSAAQLSSVRCYINAFFRYYSDII